MRRRAEYLLHRSVELAETAEPRREGDIGDGQVGVVEQPAGEVRPPGPGELIRGEAEMFVEQPA
jgi:hypothetical protein